MLGQCHGHSTNSRKIRACQPEGGYVSISLPRCLASPRDTHMNHSLASSRSLLTCHFLGEEKASPKAPLPPLLYSPPILLCQRWSELSKLSFAFVHIPAAWAVGRRLEHLTAYSTQCKHVTSLRIFSYAFHLSTSPSFNQRA